MSPNISPVDLVSLSIAGETRDRKRWSHEVKPVHWTPREAKRRADIVAGWTP